MLALLAAIAATALMWRRMERRAANLELEISKRSQ